MAAGMVRLFFLEWPRSILTPSLVADGKDL
jgi:hypothetical protein